MLQRKHWNLTIKTNSVFAIPGGGMRSIVYLSCLVVISSLNACGSATAPLSRAGQIIEQDNLEPIEAARGTAIYDHARAVASVYLGNSGCTGFLVADDLFITNNHCYEATNCSQTTFKLGDERDLPATKQQVLACKSVLSYSADLDYALYQVSAKARSTDFPSITLKQGLPAAGTPLFVVGFPTGYEFKHLDRSDNCKLAGSVDGFPNYIAHTCDTVSGSSGSSVFERATGAVIGLHWGHMGSDMNNATLMGKILDHIKTRVPSTFARLVIVP